MKILITEIAGNYLQTIKINRFDDNEIEIKRENIILYKGIAKQIIDKGDRISFKDKNNKQHKFIKYSTFTYS